MFAALKRLFGNDEPAAPATTAPHVAAAALLVEAALADGVYANLESDQIVEILLESFDFDAEKADAVLAEGEMLAEDSLSDGEKCAIEEAYVRHVASLLHVDDIQRAGARKDAERKLSVPRS